MQILDIDTSLLNDKNNEERVYEILLPLYFTDNHIIIDGVDEREEIAKTAKKQLEEIGESRVSEKYI